MKTKKRTKGAPSNARAEQPDLVPLNNALYSGFSIEQLEQRLETKSWGCDVDCGSYIECPTNGCNGLVAIE